MGAVYRKINMPSTAGHAILVVNQTIVNSIKTVGKAVLPWEKRGSIDKENKMTPNKPTNGAEKVPNRIHSSNKV